MTTIALAAKAAMAVLLLAAGAAKFADIGGFAAVVAMFVPGRVSARISAGAPVAAVAIASAEILTGAASLCWPAVGWVNLVVLLLACGFVVVAAVGYARHRGRPCRCFGALTRRRFSVRSLVQAAVLAAVAVIAEGRAPAAQLNLGLTARLLLLAAAAIMALAAHAAARALTRAGATAGTVG